MKRSWDRLQHLSVTATKWRQAGVESSKIGIGLTSVATRQSMRLWRTVASIINGYASHLQPSWLIPQNQLSGWGPQPRPTAWSPDQLHMSIFADVSWHILGRTEGCGLWGLVNLSTGIWSTCLHFHREEAEMPILFGMCYFSEGSTVLHKCF